LLQRAIHETDELLRSLHVIASRVRPSLLDDLGLSEAIDGHLTEYERRTGIKVLCRLSVEQAAHIPPTIGENVYRILQEALANIASHAQTKEATVSAEVEDGWLHMQVQDRGCGFDLENLADTSRLGVLGMRERVELLNGQFQLTSRPGEGTTIRIAIPLESSSTA
jgi:signal transduction histidine kinase